MPFDPKCKIGQQCCHIGMADSEYFLKMQMQKNRSRKDRKCRKNDASGYFLSPNVLIARR
jgi:hypothetical protein